MRLAVVTRTQSMAELGHKAVSVVLRDPISDHAVETCFSFPLCSSSADIPADIRNVLNNTFVEGFVRMTHNCDEEIRGLCWNTNFASALSGFHNP